MAIVNISGILDFETKSETQEKINEIKTELTKEIKKTDEKTVQVQKEILEHSQEQNAHSALFQAVRTEMTNSVTQAKQESVQKIQEHNQSAAAHQQLFHGIQVKLDQKADKQTPVPIPLVFAQGHVSGSSANKNEYYKSDDGMVVIHFCIAQSNGEPFPKGVRAIAHLPVGFRPKTGVASTFASASSKVDLLDEFGCFVYMRPDDYNGSPGALVAHVPTGRAVQRIIGELIYYV